MEAVNDQLKLNKFIEIYTETFEHKFSRKPLIDDNDRAAVRRLIGSLRTLKTEDYREIVQAFLSIEDEFIKGTGYKLQMIEKKINFIFSQMPHEKTGKPTYTVAFTESGVPVNSHNPNSVKYIVSGDVAHVRNPLKAILITPECLAAPAKYWTVNGVWYGGWYPVEVAMQALKYGYKVEDYVAVCKTTDCVRGIPELGSKQTDGSTSHQPPTHQSDKAGSGRPGQVPPNNLFS